ncbi:DNA polymerase III subunit beta [Brevibacillus laterosporus]|uniref:Beta sliding clamp n=2 Tax=Brevibacillus TaxID=55080 RepID=A0A0F7EFS4_BRELA|nr:MULTISPECIES: DNA polymerase III subunit beta [Brevibacillus]AKF93703.1 DNA polymerase III subunit beta [Brevibacillus laterosporus]MCR8984311.1 DNA polymerase III subunit beta [Brevibacillus laterosporus]MCZ0830034.1 DNA polymerase III subunit beta [Brevibacillus halotolerans]GIO03495.1 DNA polymerase III subunit beta [Brevibacillus halotolerans]
MKITVQRDKLSTAVSHVAKAVSTRTTIPILTGIKLTANEEGLTLTGSDSDISIEVHVPLEEGENWGVTVHEPGSIVLPSRIFSEIVRKLPANEIDISVDDRLLTLIRSGQAEFTINGLNANEYPQLPQLEEDKVFSIPSDLLKTMIRQTSFAVATSEMRPILTGIMWTLEEGILKFVATDSHRFASRNAKVECSESLRFYNIVVPGKSCNELVKIIDDDQNLVDIVVADNQILVKSNHILFYSRLLEGTYPDTNRIIPQGCKTEIVLSTKEFLQSIERASLLSREGKTNVVKLVTLPDGNVEISSNAPEIGKVTETIQPKQCTGEELKISFNAKFMIDALRSIDSSEIVTSFTGAMSPFIIRPTDHDWSLHLILPVRTY